MQQNAARDSWSFAESERRLEEIVRAIHDQCDTTAEAYGRPGDYVAGANIAAFTRVADGMLALGVVWDRARPGLALTSRPAPGRRLPEGVGDQRRQGLVGPRARPGDDVRRRGGPEAPAAVQAPFLRQPVQEPGRVQVAGAGGVVDRHRKGGDGVLLVAGDHHRALGAAGQRRHRDAAADLAHGLLEAAELEQRDDLLLVGEQHVDRAVDQLHEGLAVAVDAERVRQGERDPLAELMRQRGRLAEGVLGAGAVPQVALEVDQLGARDQLEGYLWDRPS